VRGGDTGGVEGQGLAAQPQETSPLLTSRGYSTRMTDPVHTNLRNMASGASKAGARGNCAQGRERLSTSGEQNCKPYGKRAPARGANRTDWQFVRLVDS
jgi:hypothetical protein